MANGIKHRTGGFHRTVVAVHVSLLFDEKHIAGIQEQTSCATAFATGKLLIIVGEMTNGVASGAIPECCSLFPLRSPVPRFHGRHSTHYSSPRLQPHAQSPNPHAVVPSHTLCGDGDIFTEPSGQNAPPHPHAVSAGPKYGCASTVRSRRTQIGTAVAWGRAKYTVSIRGSASKPVPPFQHYPFSI